MYAQTSPSVALAESEPPVCAIHNRPKHLRRQGQDRSPRWSCSQCEAEFSRRYRQRRRKHNVSALTSRLLRAQAERVLDLMHLVVRHCGGWDRLWQALTPAQQAELAVKLATTHDALLYKADERKRQENTAVKNAVRDPAVVATCVRILADLPPRELRQVLNRFILRTRACRACDMRGCGEGI